MRVYLCVNYSQGKTMWRTSLKNFSFTVYTQKTKAIKEYRKNNRQYIKERISKDEYARFKVIVFLLDVPDQHLKYKSGDILDKNTLEYDNSIDIVYELLPERININEILVSETWHFYIKEKRLKYKKTQYLYPLEQKK